MARQGGYEYWDARAHIFDESIAKGMHLSAVLRMMVAILTKWGLRSADNRIVTPEMLRQMTSAAGFEAVEAELLGPSVKAACLSARKPDGCIE